MAKKKKKMTKLTDKQKQSIREILTAQMTRFEKYKAKHGTDNVQPFIEAVIGALHDPAKLNEEGAERFANDFADRVWPLGTRYASMRPLFFMCAESFFDAAPKGTQLTRAQLFLGMIETALYCFQNGDDYESNWDHDNEGPVVRPGTGPEPLYKRGSIL